eukprot:gene18870-21469_t
MIISLSLLLAFSASISAYYGNNCSGYGTCTVDEVRPFGDTWKAGGELTYDYNNWDTRKTRGCVCDATYGDIDCSKRMCPYGNDVLAVRNNLLLDEKYQVQRLIFLSSTFTRDLNQHTFALTFTSRLNETFTTIPIVFDDSDITDLVNDVHLALLNLPNRVIDGLTVNVSP